MGQFFIKKPVFAMVVSIVILLAGALSMMSLPIALYPQISPPTIEVEINYPGANAETVEEAIAVRRSAQRFHAGVMRLEQLAFALLAARGSGGASLVSGLAGLAEQVRISAALPLAVIALWVVAPLAAATALFYRREV